MLSQTYMLLSKFQSCRIVDDNHEADSTIIRVMQGGGQSYNIST